MCFNARFLFPCMQTIFNVEHCGEFIFFVADK